MARGEPWFQANTNDLRLEVPEFEGKLDPEEFLDGLHTVEEFLIVNTFLMIRRSN